MKRAAILIILCLMALGGADWMLRHSPPSDNAVWAIEHPLTTKWWAAPVGAEITSPPPDVHWPAWKDDYWQMSIDTELEFGLRSDGVVVWRKRQASPTPNRDDTTDPVKKIIEEAEREKQLRGILNTQKNP